MKNFIKAISLLSLLIILTTCKKDKETEEQKLIQHEQKILDKIDGFMPKEVGSMFETDFKSMQNQKEYSLYLDSVETAIDKLINTVKLHFSLEEYSKTMNSTLNNLQNSKKSTDLVCLGLGYAKGVKVELGTSGNIGAIIVGGLQASGGGGVKVVYDFVNFERQIYYYTLCSSGYSFGAGTGVALKATVGFSGVNEVITGIRYHGNNSGLNKFEGQGISSAYSLKGTLADLFGIDLSIGMATSSSAVADLSGIGNLLPCPDNMVEIENGTTGYSVSVKGSLSVGIQAELTVALSSNTVGTNAIGIASSYKKFADKTQLAGIRMAQEIMLTDPLPGISSTLGTIDLAASTIAILYGLKDFSSCPAILPSIGTKPISNITSKSSICGGILTKDGGSNIISCGLVWSKLENPTVDNYIGIVNSSPKLGDFTCNLTNLQANATYYVRAFGTNSVGTVYGKQVSFTTQGNPTPNINNTTWDVTINFNNTTSWHADVTFNANGTTKYDEPAFPGQYLSYGVWSLNSNQIHWDIGFVDSYIFDGTVSGNSMSGTFVYGSQSKTWSASKR